MEDQLDTQLPEIPASMLRPVKGYNPTRIITLFLSNKSPGAFKVYHCGNCGRPVFHYYTEIEIVLVGEVREPVGRPIDILCRNCKTTYRIM